MKGPAPGIEWPEDIERLIQLIAKFKANKEEPLQYPPLTVSEEAEVRSIKRNHGLQLIPNDNINSDYLKTHLKIIPALRSPSREKETPPPAETLEITPVIEARRNTLSNAGFLKHLGTVAICQHCKNSVDSRRDRGLYAIWEKASKANELCPACEQSRKSGMPSEAPDAPRNIPRLDAKVFLDDKYLIDTRDISIGEPIDVRMQKVLQLYKDNIGEVISPTDISIIHMYTQNTFPGMRLDGFTRLLKDQLHPSDMSVAESDSEMARVEPADIEKAISEIKSAGREFTLGQVEELSRQYGVSDYMYNWARTKPMLKTLEPVFTPKRGQSYDLSLIEIITKYLEEEGLRLSKGIEENPVLLNEVLEKLNNSYFPGMTAGELKSIIDSVGRKIHTLKDVLFHALKSRRNVVANAERFPASKLNDLVLTKISEDVKTTSNPFGKFDSLKDAVVNYLTDPGYESIRMEHGITKFSVPDIEEFIRMDSKNIQEKYDDLSIKKFVADKRLSNADARDIAKLYVKERQSTARENYLKGELADQLKTKRPGLAEDLHFKIFRSKIDPKDSYNEMVQKYTELQNAYAQRDNNNEHFDIFVTAGLE